MRKWLTKRLLAILNTQWLNPTPCKYAHVGNIDAFDYQFLVSSEKQQPGIMVKQILKDADRFKACPLRKDGGLTVMEADGTNHNATVWDMHELHQAFASKDSQ